MRKLRGRLVLNKETLLNLQPPEVARARGGDEDDVAFTSSCLCPPSAVVSVCMTYCPKFTCTRAADGVEP